MNFKFNIYDYDMIFFFFSLDMNINRNYTKLRCYMIIGDNVQHPESGSLGCIKFFS